MNSQTMQANDLDAILSRGEAIQLVDVRSVEEFDHGHVPGAVNIPLEQVEARLADFKPGARTVLVCQGGRRAGLCKERLADRDGEFLVLEGGTDAWVKAGLPVVVTAVTRMSLMRQVQLLVGVLILVSAVLTLMVNPYWVLMAAVIGVGLTIAGATGFCGMAHVLAIMPWNRAPIQPKVSV